jgi:hypothetical protein
MVSCAMRSFLTSRVIAIIILFLQIAPLLLFPGTSFSISSQEWWLPAMLTLLVIISLIQIIIRRSQAAWPWYLISFAQGFNIISRLMMLLPHTTMNVSGVQRFNTAWVTMSLASMILSVLVLWYCELVEVRGRFSS